MSYDNLKEGKGMGKEINGKLRSHMVMMPEGIWRAKGLRIFGRKIKAIVFCTDIAIIRNINADAVIAVYPFTPQPIITQSILNAANMPVFAGVGGGLTSGKRSVELARHAEHQGATGVVLNAPASNDLIKSIAEVIDIPILVTIVSENDDIDGRIASKAAILNVSASSQTPKIVADIRKKHSNIPIVATGGPTEETIKATIDAGADAITWTPPTTSSLFKGIMESYRNGFMQIF